MHGLDLTIQSLRGYLAHHFFSSLGPGCPVYSRLCAPFGNNKISPRPGHLPLSFRCGNRDVKAHFCGIKLRLRDGHRMRQKNLDRTDSPAPAMVPNPGAVLGWPLRILVSAFLWPQSYRRNNGTRLVTSAQDLLDMVHEVFTFDALSLFGLYEHAKRKMRSTYMRQRERGWPAWLRGCVAAIMGTTIPTQHVLEQINPRTKCECESCKFTHFALVYC